MRANVPGEVLEVDIRQAESGGWRYHFLVLGRDRRYHEVVVDARTGRLVMVRRR